MRINMLSMMRNWTSFLDIVFFKGYGSANELLRVHIKYYIKLLLNTFRRMIMNGSDLMLFYITMYFKLDRQSYIAGNFLSKLSLYSNYNYFYYFLALLSL